MLDAGLVDTDEIVLDGTHIKAVANNHKYRKQEIKQQAKFMSEQLEIEIERDRKKHEKKSLKPAKESVVKEKKVSTTDPESGWFHKGEHKEVFAYNAQVACDKHAWALAYSIEAGNVHDSQAFPNIFPKLEGFHPKYIIADSGYKTPSIAKCLFDKEITPVFPYTRPRGKKDGIKAKDFIYDDYYDCCLCPANQVLAYSTTNRDGYREYKSNPKICQTCPMLTLCTESKTHQKVVTRHIWRDYLDSCEDIRHGIGMKDMYKRRKETIERLFGTAKEYHNFRYTRERGKSKMRDKVGLTLACLNLKKLVRMMAGSPFYFALSDIIYRLSNFSVFIQTKRQTSNQKFVFNLMLNMSSAFFIVIKL